MRRIAVVAAVGWGWIVWLGWSLADRRIAICGYGEEGCRIRATAARDAVLTHGLTVLLIGAVIAAVVAGGVLNRFRRPGSGVSAVNDARHLVSDRSRELWRSWRGRASRIDRQSIAIGAAILGLVVAAFAGLDRSSAWVGLGETPPPEATETAAEVTDGVTYEIQAPNGKTYRIDGPAGATDAQVRAQVLAGDPHASSPAPKLTPVDGNPFAVGQPPERSPAGTRNVTVTFADGSSHVYLKVPDQTTPDQVTQRAQRDFGKAVTAIDGGR